MSLLVRTENQKSLVMLYPSYPFQVPRQYVTSFPVQRIGIAQEFYVPTSNPRMVHSQQEYSSFTSRPKCCSIKLSLKPHLKLYTHLTSSSFLFCLLHSHNSFSREQILNKTLASKTLVCLRGYHLLNLHCKIYLLQIHKLDSKPQIK